MSEIANTPQLKEGRENREFKKPYRPKRPNGEVRNFQHVKILDCSHLVSRVIYECWHCKQGILCEVDVSTQQLVEVECPSCGKTAIRLMANQALSTTPIPSPWGK
jgi:DNA-directed RNA polymerase subunit RPC12/RpoP